MGSALKLYSPPSGNTPQGLPDYWKFPNGVIRRDLREIDDAELHLLGWTGPYTRPTQKHVIENVNVPSEAVEELNSREDYTFDAENNCWVSLNHDYDPETHKVIWYSRERRYVILPIDADTTEYGIPYRSGVQPQHRINSEVTTNKKVIYKYVPENQLPAPAPVLWDNFKKGVLRSDNYNQFITSLMTTRPSLAVSFPSSLSKLDLGIYTDFRSDWTVATENDLVSAELKTELKELATDCNLPKDFFDVVGE